MTGPIGFSSSSKGLELGWALGGDQEQLHERLRHNTQQLDGEVHHAFSYDARSSFDLNYAYFGGLVDTGVAWLEVLDDTIVLVDDQVSYVERDPTTGAVTANAIGWTYALIPMAKVTTRHGRIAEVLDSRPHDTTGGGSGGGGCATFACLAGTALDSQITQSSVVQHEAALTILETQITNGSILARVADNETITGTYNFTPAAGSPFLVGNAGLVTDLNADYLDGEHGVYYTDLDNILINVIGTPTYVSAQEELALAGSAGIIVGGAVTDAGGATIDVAAGEGFIRSSDSALVDLLSFEWSASLGLVIPADTQRWVVVDYNGGAPAVALETSFTSTQDKILLGTVVNEAGTLHLAGFRDETTCGVHEILHAMREIDGITRADALGGLIIGETGARNVTVSAGEIYWGSQEFDYDAVDTSGADTFETYYQTAGTWTHATGVSQWDNLQYNDTASGLVTLTNNRYANLWWYGDVEGELVMVYGTGQYVSIGAAQLEEPPSVPPRVESHCLLLGRYIFQKNSATTDEIDSAFSVTLTQTGVTAHSALSGLTTGDDHTQYFYLAGRAGGQTAYGGTVTGQDLTLRANTANDGTVFLQDLGGDVVIGPDPGGTEQFRVGLLTTIAPTVSGSVTAAVVVEPHHDATAASQYLRMFKIDGVYDTNGYATVNTVTTLVSPQYGTLGTHSFGQATDFYIGGGTGGTVTISDWRGLYIAPPGGATLTEGRGVYVADMGIAGAGGKAIYVTDQTAGGYSLYTNDGLVRFGGSIYQAHGAALMHRMYNSGGAADTRQWEMQLQTNGDLEFHSTTDVGVTVQTALSLAHATGDATFAGGIVATTGAFTADVTIERTGSNAAFFAESTLDAYLVLDSDTNATAQANSVVIFKDTAISKWYAGKNTSGAFSIYDYTAAASVFSIVQNGAMTVNPTGNITLAPGGGTVLIDVATTGNAILTIDSNDSDAYITLNGGSDGVDAEESVIYMQGGGTNYWKLGKASSHNFVLYDFTGTQLVLEVADGGDMTLSPTGDILLRPVGGQVMVGVADTTRGEIRCYGHATGSTNGGIIRFYTAADYDTNVNYYSVTAVGEDFYIGDDAQELLRFDWSDDRWETSKAFVMDDLFAANGTFTGDVEINGALNHDGSAAGFYATAPVAQQTITGSRGGNAALADLLTKLALTGILIDSTT